MYRASIGVVMSHDVLECDLFDRAPDDRIRVLDADGTVVAPELEPDLEPETLRSMYRDMRFSRRFDERMISLQRQGRLGTYSSLAGQEGSQIGSTYALADDDMLSFQYREHGRAGRAGTPLGVPAVLDGPRGRERRAGGHRGLSAEHLDRQPPPRGGGWSWRRN